MNNEKIENLLNLALDASTQERKKSQNLNVGFDSTTDTWEVIVKFYGTEAELAEIFQNRFGEAAAGIRMEGLSNEYVILQIPENLVNAVADIPEIEYMEKPKELFFAVSSGKSVSCISPLQTGEAEAGARNLTGRGILVAVVDSGIDYAHPDFRNSDGTTRIVALWDQTLEAVYDSETINLALAQETETARYAICPSRDLSGHGTHVAGIAAGNGRASGGRFRGVAYESELLIVKLGTPRENTLPRTTELMRALDFCVKEARRLEMPVAINLSFGNSYGSHSGTSLIETFINDMADFGRNIIVIGSGNDGAAALHTAGRVSGNRSVVVEFSVSEYETALNLQLWKNYVDRIDIALVAPNGTRVGPIQQILGSQRFRIGDTELLLYYGEPTPYSPYQEIYFEFLPVGTYLNSGIWQIELIPRGIVYGDYNMWLPSGSAVNAGTAFLNPVEETTLTIPSTASKGMTVAAYDGRFNQPVAFSGRGYTRETNQIKPDIAAPGVEITSCAVGGGYEVRTGTSMATPFVTGGAALLMQWGIVEGNDSYLYGEKLKAYLIRGAKRDMAGILNWPNPQLGWGTLCLAESFPG